MRSVCDFDTDLEGATYVAVVQRFCEGESDAEIAQAVGTENHPFADLVRRGGGFCNTDVCFFQNSFAG